MLDGVTALDLATVGPAARASRWLADYGATVVKVGAVPSREGVQIVPVFHAYSGHRGMLRAAFDLKSPEGREAFLRLAERADVVIESFRPGVVARLGIGYGDVSARNPGVVYCSTSGYGQDGPRARWAGHDLNYLAVSGFLDCSQPAGADGQPPIPGVTLADSAAGGMHAVMSILAALVRRASTGAGAYLDVSVADGMLALMALQVDEYLATGERPGYRTGVTSGRWACYGTYRTGDGRWLSVAAIENRFWRNLCAAVGLDKWADHQTDDAVQEEVRADLRRVFAGRARDAWVALLAPADTCVAPVLSVDEVVADPQYAARGAFADAEHPSHGALRQVAPTLAGMPAPPSDAPYELREADVTDTDALLADAGMSADDIAGLRDAGVIA